LSLINLYQGKVCSAIHNFIYFWDFSG